MNRRTIVVAGLLVGVAVVVEALAVPVEHAVFPWQRLPGWHALIGFVGCLVLIRLGKTIGGRWLQIPEDIDDDAR